MNDLFTLSDENWPAGLVDITDRLVIREFTPDEAELCRELYAKCGCMTDKAPAELSPEEKNGISHRGQALRKMKEIIKDLEEGKDN